MNLNKVFLIGRLTQNPEIRTTPSGQTVCNFGLATNRIWNDQNTKERQEQTEYHNIVLWRRLAEIASQYLSKGSLVLIEGRIQTRSWQDQNGVKKYKAEIVADNIQLGPKPASQAGFQPKPPLINQAQPNQQTSQPSQQTQMPKEEEIPIIEEDNSPPSADFVKKDDEEIDISQIPF